MTDKISYIQIVRSIRDLGLTESPVCLHSSLKSFGYVDGGADAVIRAFVDSGCTLVVPTFTYDCAVPPPPGRQVAQNGWDGDWYFNPQGLVPFDKNSAMISPDMGAIPARLLHWDERVRGDHPLNSFSAVGPLAAELIEPQGSLDVYDPFKVLYTHPAAYVLLAGVELTRATAIHFAEERAGRRLFRRWAQNAAGATVETAVGSCSEGFENLAPSLCVIETRAAVGKSQWRVYPFRPFIDLATRAIVQNPQVTHCADANCVRCNDAVKGGPLV